MTATAAAEAARQLHEVLDPYHAVTYLAPESAEHFRSIGLTGPWSGYFAGRVAPLGPVGPAVITATMYHFQPAMVAEHTAGLWAAVTPDAVLTARMNAVDTALRGLLGKTLDAPELAEAAELSWTASTATPWPARALGAANAVLPRPSEPHLVLWQAATTLREARGEGHGMALADAELDGVEALVLHTAAGGERRRSIQARRGWSDPEWEEGARRLVQRGVCAADGSLTPEGAALHRDVEARTDRLAQAPWHAVGPERSARLVELMGPITGQVVSGLRKGSGA